MSYDQEGKVFYVPTELSLWPEGGTKLRFEAYRYLDNISDDYKKLAELQDRVSEKLKIYTQSKRVDEVDALGFGNTSLCWLNRKEEDCEDE
jgi:hypothetical protein